MAKKKPKKTDQAAVLAGKLVAALTALRSQGGEAYPVSLARLGALADPQATAIQLRRAAGKHVFISKAVAARRGCLDAPVALVEDLPMLAAAPATLEMALREKRTHALHAHTVAELTQRLTSKLQAPFKQMVLQQVEQGTLPPTVGWIGLRGAKLFLIEDLQPAALRAKLTPVEAAAAAPPAEAVAGGAEAAEGLPRPDASPSGDDRSFETRFEAAFDELDRRGGTHNFVSLVDLRRALGGVSRGLFVAGLRSLRRAGRFTLSAAESRSGITPEQRAAGIEEAGALLLYVSRKSP